MEHRKMRKYNNENMDACCKEAQLINQIEQNRGSSGTISNIFLATILFETALVAYIVDWSDITKDNFFIIFACIIFTIMIFAIEYSMFFVSAYLSVDGKDKMQTQALMPCIVRMPCSIDKLFRQIQSKIQKKIMCNLVIIFAILFAGIFITPYQGAEIGKIMEIHMPENMVHGVFGCMIVTLLAAAGFLIGIAGGKKVYYRVYWTLRERSDTKQKNRKTYKRNTKIHNLIYFFINLSVFAFNGIMEWILSVRYAMPENLEGHCVLTNSNIMLFINIVFGLILVSYLSDREVSRKVAVLCFMVLLIGNIYWQTTYTCYYQDRIETKKVWEKQEYQWEDVDSFVVEKTKAPYELQMHITIGNHTFVVMGNNVIDSELHSNQYNEEKDYILALTKRLTDLGIKGTLKNKDKLEAWDDVSAYNELLQYIE